MKMLMYHGRCLSYMENLTLGWRQRHAFADYYLLQYYTIIIPSLR